MSRPAVRPIAIRIQPVSDREALMRSEDVSASAICVMMGEGFPIMTSSLPG